MRDLRKLSCVPASFLLMLLCGFATQAKDKPAKIKASAIQVDMIHSDEIKLPAEFQVSMYEDLIRQLGRFRTRLSRRRSQRSQFARFGDSAQQRHRLQRRKPAQTRSDHGHRRNLHQNSLHFLRQRGQDAPGSRCDRESPIFWRKPAGNV